MSTTIDQDTGPSTTSEPEEDNQNNHPAPDNVILEKVPTAYSTAKVEVVGDKIVFRPTWQFRLAFLALSTLCLAVAFDATTLPVALPTVSTDLGGTALQAFWSGTSFLLASTSLQPTVASLSNIFGRKYLIYISSVFFLAGCIIGGLAGNFTVLIVGRTIQGIGGGGIMSLTEMVIADLVPLQFRGEWMALVSMSWAVGTVFGPLIGAGFTQNVTWRWIFYVNIPIIAIGMALIYFFLNQSPIPGGVPQKLKRFDWIGSLWFMTSSTLFLFGLTAGGTMYAWKSAAVLVPLLVGPLSLVGFAWYEARIAGVPIIKKAIFSNWDMIVSYIMTIVHGMITWSLVYFIILYYQGVKLYTPLISGVAGLPESLCVAPGAGVVGVVVARTGHYRWSLWSGWALTTLGAGLLVLLGPDTTIPQWIFLNIPISLGIGMLFPSMGLSMQAACAPAHNADAMAFFSFSRNLGQAIGVAASGVLFQNAFRTQLLGLPDWRAEADVLSRDATAVVDMVKAMAPGAARRDLIGAYSGGLRDVWIFLTALAAVCFLLSFTVKGFSLKQEHVTEQGYQVREKEGKEKGMEDVER
ncbi:MFS general substrate transporter [Cryphonectria parasitica EP155]|uniref:MFS general substrate transporter n=1 Tax=Cryphonectria parasitica (strain ATCC 38755 / EP155) TaxID=660469 RepID=A0A9P4XWT7_CRYP1|nr:MFS general substrate transporter [Cryphonectria parasitica EP155]KAF3762252.1 MFS general substrate transporter [Cryphonectria parasitica EP155]